VACGEEVKFFVDVKSEEMPKIDAEVVLMSPDAGLAEWFTQSGIRHRPYAPGGQTNREVLLASGKPAADPEMIFRDFAQRVARGSTIIFLTPDTYARGGQTSSSVIVATVERDVFTVLPWLMAMAALNCIRHHLSGSKINSVFTGESGYRALTARRRALGIPNTPSATQVPAMGG
jgi:hypothetical protein